MEKITLNVSGMSCGHCENAVKTALSSLDGVAAVTVSLKEGKVDVEYAADKVSAAQMKTAIEDQGYDVA
ncbi:copper-binding protein [Lottiidibacillus patelloidae]|uniref:Copper chaperone CopZ n=1 Tax=Lottiidibacillus patelloidae TaxID=2670334 RepID=A0A263BVF8_9BACI|nr:copper chaperone CopZ [Lottiidibacillus patelloidae]OZM57532.1 copper-binding protein [Lottiidibacillus patelloidae]